MVRSLWELGQSQGPEAEKSVPTKTQWGRVVLARVSRTLHPYGHTRIGRPVRLEVANTYDQ